MTPPELAFYTALVLAPSACSVVAAVLVAHRFAIGRAHPKTVRMIGLLLGLVLTPPAMITVGTIGGGYWDTLGLPGGPLVGIILTLSVAVALATILLTGGVLFVWDTAGRAGRRLPR